MRSACPGRRTATSSCSRRLARDRPDAAHAGHRPRRLHGLDHELRRSRRPLARRLRALGAPVHDRPAVGGVHVSPCLDAIRPSAARGPSRWRRSAPSTSSATRAAFRGLRALLEGGQSLTASRWEGRARSRTGRRRARCGFAGVPRPESRGAEVGGVEAAGGVSGRAIRAVQAGGIGARRRDACAPGRNSRRA